MNAIKALMIALLATSQLAVAAEQAANANEQDNNAELQSYYMQQCTHLADAQNQQGEAREEFMQSCMADAPDVWPAGQEKD